MALAKCHECGHQVSTDAKACPQCGAKIKQPTSRFTILIVGLICIGFAKFIFDPEPSPPPVAEQTPEQAAAKLKKEAEFQRVVIGAKALKQAAKNPDSFKLTSAALMESGAICYEYRATNSFNAVTPGKFVVSKNGGSAEAAAWNKHCGGKSGTDYSYARQAL